MTFATPWHCRLVVALVLTLFAGLVLLPVAVALGYSFLGENGPSVAAYRQVLGDARQGRLFINTLVVAGGAVLLATVLGVAAGWALERGALPAWRLWWALTLVPLLIPGHAAALAWIDAAGAHGLLPKTLSALFGMERELPSLTGRGGAIFLLGLGGYPIVAFATALALRRFGGSFSDAARLCLSPAQRLFRIEAPLVMPFIVVATLAVFLLSLGAFSVPSLLQVDVYATEIFTTFSAFYDTAAATAQSMLLLVCAAAAVGGVVIYMAPRRAWLRGESAAPRPPRFRPGRSFFALLAVSIPVLLAGVMPLAVLVWRSLPLTSYGEVWTTAREEMATSLALGAAASTAMVGGAFFLAYVRRAGSRAAALRWLSLAPLVMSGPALGVALIALWNRNGWPGAVYDSFAILVIACVARFFFFAQCGADAAFRQVDPRFEDAAYVAGVPWWRCAFRLFLPLLWPAVVAVWALAFILCLGEIDTTTLVCPPGANTLAARVHSLMHYGPSALVAALNVTTVVLILTLAAGAAAVLARKGWVRHGRH